MTVPDKTIKYADGLFDSIVARNNPNTDRYI